MIRMEMENELQTIYSTRKSFNGKAIVRTIIDDNSEHIELVSYGTLVANYVYYKDKNEKVYEYYGRYSCTTSSHQKEFFRQLGLSEKETKDLMKDGTFKVLRVQA